MDEDEYPNETPESLSGLQGGGENLFDADEYEDDAYAEEETVEAEAEAEAPVAEAAQDTQASVTPRPFQPTGNPYMDNARQKLEEYGLGEIADDLYNAIRHEQQQGFTAQAYAGSYQAQIAEAAPELMRVHGRSIPEYESQLPPEVRGTPVGALLAALGPEIAEMQRTGDLRGAMQRIGRLLNPQTREPQRQARPVPTLAPEQRIPTPSVRGGGAAGGGRPAGTARPRGAAGVFADVFGLSGEEAESTVASMKRTRG